MKKALMVSSIVCLFVSSFSLADMFGDGTNQFTIDFVSISGDAGDLGSWDAGYTFSGVNHGDYRMGTYEITNDQWAKFQNSLGISVTGSPSNAYDDNPYWTGANLPTNNVSWYEAAQFVNWLNTSTGHHAAYNFTGAQGTGDYTLDVWDTEDAWGGTNLYRHKDAYYFLPTEDEWVKAAYWNGTTLQTYATIDDLTPTAGVDSNYDGAVGQPWNVGSGNKELNGTFDMMGNVYEFLESPLFLFVGYLPDSGRCHRGGSYLFKYGSVETLKSSYQSHSVLGSAYAEYDLLGFRVASVACPSADLTGDCFVDLEDLAVLMSQWLTGSQ